ncbi:hypothetical protein FOA52_003118 [Chlamydomonas sp. UWO 241]|nr:hypothetical protein FOA52_003118 [Chlamydomonas sp. UWO 241]
MSKGDGGSEAGDVSRSQQKTSEHKKPVNVAAKGELKLKPVPKPKSDSDASFWPYPTDYMDHFETTDQALADLEPALYRLATHLGKTKAELRVYDPYYCKGAIRKHYEAIGIERLIHEGFPCRSDSDEEAACLAAQYYCKGAIRKHYAAIGIERLIHEKRDFYADISAGTVPEYDLLITNPPYSSDHKERILQFCKDSGKPWALLMPNYVANKQYYSDEAEQHPSAPFFLVGSTGRARMATQVPKTKYEYEHPSGKGKESSPFFSIWFVHLGDDNPRVLSWWEKLAAKKPGGVKVMRTLADLHDANAAPAWKRLNPKQRKKIKAQKEEQE